MTKPTYFPLVVFFVVVGLLAVALRPVVREVEIIDRPLPPVKTVSLIEGESFHLPPLYWENRPYLINVFASWCLPCRAEHPVLMDMKDSVPIYGISYKDTLENTQIWLRELGNPYTAVGLDPLGKTGIEFGLTGVPESFVVDAHGRIVYHHHGPISSYDWEEVFAPLFRKLKAGV